MFDVCFTHGPQNAPQQVPRENGIGVVLLLMPQRRVPLAPAVELMAPAEGNFIAVSRVLESVLVGIVERGLSAQSVVGGRDRPGLAEQTGCAHPAKAIQPELDRGRRGAARERVNR